MAQTKGKSVKQANRQGKAADVKSTRRPLRDLDVREAAKVKGGRGKRIIPCF